MAPMPETRVTLILAADELKLTNSMIEAYQREETKKNQELLRTRAMEILSLVLISSPAFSEMFLVQPIHNLSTFVFSYFSDRTLVVDMLSRCPKDQLANLGSYKFTSHPVFEKKITQLTGTVEKPNSQLAKCRPWDVALNTVVKIEALEGETMSMPIKRLLFREHLIIKHLWDFYIREKLELDEMTGIPIVFHYEELPNPIYNYDATTEYKVYDVFGKLVTWKSKNRSTLSYMCMEQMGPNLQYLMEVMQSGKKRGCIFDMDTAFKIFDQLLCRCLQIHRFNVVHNAIEPSNIYFGRNIAFNVLYLLNFNVATVFDPNGNTRGHRSDNELHGTLRFASHKQLAGSPIHPVHDLESAFYTLIAMLTNKLPWDSMLSIDRNQSQQDGMNTARNSPALDENLSNVGTVDQPDLTKLVERNVFHKLGEAKTNFWKGYSSIVKILTDIKYIANGDDRHRVPLVMEIVQDLYSKIRDLLQTVGSDAAAPTFFSNLLQPHSTEYQIYADLRRTTLLFFRFESLSNSISTPTYQKKVESVSQDDCDGNLRVAWNLTNWCFNGISIEVSNTSRTSADRAVLNRQMRTAS